MVSFHHGVAYAVIAAAGLAGLAGIWTIWRRREAGRLLPHLLAAVQSLLILQVAIGLLLLGGHHRAAHKLHYLYGTIALLAVLSPWVYAPADPRRRLVWFVGATLVAAALGVRAYLSAT